MNRTLSSLILLTAVATWTVTAEDASRPPKTDAGTFHVHLLPRGAEDALDLSADQRKELADLEAESKGKIAAILTPEQMEKLTTVRPPSKRDGNRRPAPAPSASRNSAAGEPAATRPSADARPLPPGVTRYPVAFSGGHDTVPVDHGRPVVLIAAALGVPDEVFREAFSHVHPAGPGSGGPSDSEARANKQALMSRLGKYGVTDSRLNTVSNFYRYPPGSRNLWRNKPATANALVKDGAIVSFEVVDGGYGYTTPPAVSVPGIDGAAAVAQLSYSKEFETNGAIASITISPSK